MDTPRLLVIDDDADLGQILVEIGRELGYDALHTDNHDEFRTYVKDWQPAVIITDLQMPRVDGVKVLRFLAEVRTTAKVIILSGMERRLIGLSESIGRDLGLDVAAALSKPFRYADVHELLARLKSSIPVGPREVRDAIVNREIDIFFQPKCDTSTGALLGVEALARWKHPERGWISPDIFIPITDQAGLAEPLLELVMEKAVAEMVKWSEIDLDIAVAVNMSAKNLEVRDLPDRLEQICAAAGVSCDRLTLELTESQSMAAGLDSLEVLTRLRLKGFHLSIDDFGTGFSSLLRLRQLPFSELKIDQSFVSGICSDKDSASIAQAMVLLARNMGMSCVAEGIENVETIGKLKELGCHLGQGFYFAKAMPADEIGIWMESQSPARDVNRSQRTPAAG